MHLKGYSRLIDRLGISFCTISDIHNFIHSQGQSLFVCHSHLQFLNLTVKTRLIYYVVSTYSIFLQFA